MSKHNFQDLKIWQRSMDLVDDVYALTCAYPKLEQFGLIAQSRRAAISVPSNIAEGSQRVTNKDFSKFVLIAKGSLAELLTQILIAERQKYISYAEAKKIKDSIEELHKMLFSFYKKISAEI